MLQECKKFGGMPTKEKEKTEEEHKLCLSCFLLRNIVTAIDVKLKTAECVTILLFMMCESEGVQTPTSQVFEVSSVEEPHLEHHHSYSSPETGGLALMTHRQNTWVKF